MNEIEAHELSLEMWTWLADNSRKGKEDWHKYNTIKDLLACCFLCEYYKVYHCFEYTFNCMNCCLDCMKSDSIYDDYSSNNIGIRNKAAIKIRDTIAKKLEELKEI